MAKIPPTISPALMDILRVRIGLTVGDTSMDAEITMAWEATYDWVEQYLDRYLVPGTYDETVVHKSGHVISLKGYPIDTVNSITSTVNNSAVFDYHVNKTNGNLFIDGGFSEHELTINYTALDPVTGSIYMAMLFVFDLVYTNFGSTTNSTAGGTIKSISSDGAKVDYDLSLNTSGAGGIDAETGLPENAIGLLAMFRRYQC